MKWWNGIWLNEAFATLMELLCVDALPPRVAALGVASASNATWPWPPTRLHSTRPVEYPVGPPEEAQGMFDVLTYQKGAGVLRMLERYLGAERFRDGIRRYLDDAPLRQHRDRRPVGRHRSGQRRTGARHHGHLDPPGRLPPRDRRQRRRPTPAAGTAILSQEPFPYASADRTERHRLDVEGAGHRPRSIGGADARVLLGSDPESPSTSALTPTPTPWWSTPADRASTACATPPDPLRRLAGRLGALDALERFNLLGDTWASVVAGRSDARRLPPAGRGARRRGRPRRLGPGHRGAVAPRPRRRRRHPAPGRRTPGPCSARCSPAWDGSPGPARDERTADAAGPGAGDARHRGPGPRRPGRRRAGSTTRP